MHSLARVVLVLLLLAPPPAVAVIGGAPAPDTIASRTALVVSTRGASCSAAVLTRDLLLTAAHCVGPPADYAVVVFESAGPRLVPVARVALHPRFDADMFAKRRPTPDLALAHLAEPLPASFLPAQLARDTAPPRKGDRFLLAGYGVTSESDPRSAGKLHSLILPAIGNTIDATGVIMVRLSAGGQAPAGACTGDSGGPVFRNAELAAIVGWSTGKGSLGCGHVTGATLVAPQLDWIAKTANEMGVTVDR